MHHECVLYEEGVVIKRFKRLGHRTPDIFAVDARGSGVSIAKEL